MLLTRFYVGLSACLFLLNAASAHAQHCRDIANPQERLACFDRQGANHRPRKSDPQKNDPIKDAIHAYLKDHLVDPYSLRDLEIGQPKKGTTRRTDLSPAGIVGYAVPVSYNAKNRMGGYTGKTREVAFVSANKVLFMFDEIVLNVEWGPVKLEQ